MRRRSAISEEIEKAKNELTKSHDRIEEYVYELDELLVATNKLIEFLKKMC